MHKVSSAIFNVVREITNHAHGLARSEDNGNPIEVSVMKDEAGRVLLCKVKDAVFLESE